MPRVQTPENGSGAAAEIERRIRRRGRITFAEFMEVALFWPQGGYYLGRSPIGASGDYYTSPSVHPAFGALLAVQLLQMWYLMGRPHPFTVVEMGAGNGLLARDILSYSSHLLPEFRRSLRYVCMDFRAVAGLEAALPSFQHEPTENAPRASRIAAAVPAAGVGPDSPSGSQGLLYGIPLSGVRGCILSNELLDAFPVHQVKVRRGMLQEVYVALQNHQLVETLGDPSCSELRGRLESMGVELAEGQVAEINLGIDRWAGEIASALESGFVLTVDYGKTATQLYSAEERPDGTLTTYYRHTQTDDPFRHVGSQDITAQVDFTAVVQAGRAHGLSMLGYTRQSDFLRSLGLGDWQRRLGGLNLSQQQTQANRAGILDLARIGGLGDFKVLAQGKNVGKPSLWGFNSVPDQAHQGGSARPEGLPVPLLTRDHLPFLEGRYPRAEAEINLEKLWPPGPV
ncbi:MAG: class I SAM-dependent methyltransferase [Stenotrophomonas maltophilia]